MTTPPDDLPTALAITRKFYPTDPRPEHEGEPGLAEQIAKAIGAAREERDREWSEALADFLPDDGPKNPGEVTDMKQQWRAGREVHEFVARAEGHAAGFAEAQQVGGDVLYALGHIEAGDRFRVLQPRSK
jgi:hypothetical protein